MIILRSKLQLKAATNIAIVAFFLTGSIINLPTFNPSKLPALIAICLAIVSFGLALFMLSMLRDFDEIAVNRQGEVIGKRWLGKTEICNVASISAIKRSRSKIRPNAVWLYVGKRRVLLPGGACPAVRTWVTAIEELATKSGHTILVDFDTYENRDLAEFIVSEETAGGK